MRSPLQTLSSRVRHLLQQWRKVRWYRRMRRFYAQFIKPGDLAFDVGANMGSRTRVFLQLGARVVAVEPQKECARALFLAFHAYPHFVLVNQALGAAEGVGEMFVSNLSLTSSLSQEWIQSAKHEKQKIITWPTSRQISMTTLDALIHKHGQPAFAKIDVEGYEDQVLQGLSYAIPALSLEFQPTFLKPALQSIDYLKRFGPLRLNYAIHEQFEWKLDKWVTPDEMMRILEQNRNNPAIISGDVYVRREN